MTVEVVEIKTNKALKAFINFPLKLYKDSLYYVPSIFNDEMNTLRADRNPALKESRARYWLAYQDGKIVGRIAAMIVPRHEEKWGERYMRFGWIDFIDDREVISALIGKVEAWAQEEKMDGVHGPLGFTDLDREGMLVEGFDEMTTLATIYNYPYYPKHIEALGYTKDADWIEHEFTFSLKSEEKVAKAAKIIKERTNTRLFKGTKKDLLKLAPQIFAVLNEAYRHLYGTVPLSEEQVQMYIKSYFGFVNPEFIPLVLDENDRVVAFGISFPSFSRALQKSKGKLFPFGFIHFLRAMHNNDRADLYLVGVTDEYLSKGVTAMMMQQIFQTFKDHGVKLIESNATLEKNPDILAMWKYLDNRQHKRRRCYIKKFHTAIEESN